VTPKEHLGLPDLEDVKQGKGSGRRSFEAHLTGKGVRWISYDDWRKIDEAEIANAPEGAPRRKFATVDEMLEVLK